jgi:AraC family transcriptional regulator of adaptative response / DNA-3-methyladenine glycosylase II
MGTVEILDDEHCYRALMSRDRRFDGWFFTAVRTTGVYCRPSCPARTPMRANVVFYRTAATAQHHGFRACKRCRPDASPGSPEWDQRSDLVARAMSLIADGVVDRDGVPGLAARLAYSERQLNRIMTSELGVGPLALAREHRARHARTLIETTDLSFSDVAFAAGFGSVRQFNDSIRVAYGVAPRDLRRRGSATSGDRLRLTLAARPPFAAAQLFEFLAARAIPGIEFADGAVYSRSLRLPHGHGVAHATVSPGGRGIDVELGLADLRDVKPAVNRLRRLFDLDADPVAVDALLGGDRVVASLVERAPGLRVAGSVDPFETAVRAIVGQQVSISGARTVAGRLVEAAGEPLTLTHPHVTTVFPAPDALAAAVDEVFTMPASRRETIRGLCRAVLQGEVVLDHSADRDDVRRQLVELRGVGPWTAEYVAMRGLGDPDAFLPTDLGVRRSLDALGAGCEAADNWRPWRSYALHHLWNTPSLQQTA